MGRKHAIVVVVDGVEELEATAPIDLLRRAGVEVTVAAAGGTPRVTGRNGIVLEADCLLAAVTGKPVDLLVIPGGPGHKTLLGQESLLKLIKAHHEGGGWTGSICAGPVVLGKAGILDGKRFTSFPATRDLLPGREPDQPVVRDGKLVTSQGAGTAVLFALELVACLCGGDKQREIAASICHPD